MNLRSLLALLLGWPLAGALAAAEPPAAPTNRGAAKHVVVVVWDGMRPDFVTPQFCPNLYSLTTNGVFFAHHHPVFISTTEVNGAALATGLTPGRNGILANVVYQPSMSTTTPYATESLEAVRRGDFLTAGHYLGGPTIAEILHSNGLPTEVAGTKSVALFQDRSPYRTTPSQTASVTLFEGRTIPRDHVRALEALDNQGAFPAKISSPNTPQDAWTTRSLVRDLWKGGVPPYTLLWLSEPDKSQHANGVGSPEARAAIASSDDQLGLVIATLQQRQIWDQTDLLVVSDHGFSSIQGTVDLAGLLRKQRFHAGTQLDEPQPGDVLVVGLGGSALLYVVNHDEAVVQRLTAYLQASDFAGVIFSRSPREGTFPLPEADYAPTPNAPDLIVSLRWQAATNQFGFPGLVQATGGAVGKGTHGSLSRFEMHNTLIARGPDFKVAFTNEIPSGNLDVAPTVLWLLGVPAPEGAGTLSGRVLREALRNTPATPTPVVTTQTLRSEHGFGPYHWLQYLKYSEVSGTRYYEEGNGEYVKQ